MGDHWFHVRCSSKNTGWVCPASSRVSCWSAASLVNHQFLQAVARRSDASKTTLGNNRAGKVGARTCDLSKIYRNPTFHVAFGYLCFDCLVTFRPICWSWQIFTKKGGLTWSDDGWLRYMLSLCCPLHTQIGSTKNAGQNLLGDFFVIFFSFGDLVIGKGFWPQWTSHVVVFLCLCIVFCENTYYMILHGHSKSKHGHSKEHVAITRLGGR